MNRGGLTLAEVVVSVGIMAALIVTSVTLFTALMAANRKTSSTMVGVVFANLKLEEIVESGNFTDVTGSQGAYVMDATQGTQFYFQTHSEALSGEPSASSPHLGGYLVTVEVWWNASSPGKVKAGVGLQQVRVQRFIYPRVPVP